MNGNNDMNSYLTRSVSKDALNHSHLRSNTYLNITETNEHILRPTSAGQQIRTGQLQSKPSAGNLENDFQSKRDFFENRTYTDNLSSSIQTNILPTKPKLYTLSPSNSQITNHNLFQPTTINPQRNITR
jgi:hypothetical protein